MGKLDEQVRARVMAWCDAQMTRTEFGRKIGRNDSWVSRYFDNNHDADFDTVKRMAEACGHSLFEVLDAVPDSSEGELLEVYRALRPEAREISIKALRLMSTTAKPGRTRKRRAE